MASQDPSPHECRRGDKDWSELVTDLDFDTSVLGVKTARLGEEELTEQDLVQCLAYCKAECGVSLLFWQARQDWVQTRRIMERANLDGHFVNDRILWRAGVSQEASNSLSHATHATANLTIGPFGGREATPSLLALGVKAGAFSRFNLDERVSRQQFERLFSTSLANSVLGRGIDDVVLVARNGNEEVGMMALCGGRGARGSEAAIRLIAVDDEYQGQGVARCLIAAAFSWALGQGCTSIVAWAQEKNVWASRLYTSTGFVLEERWLDFHFWLSPQPRESGVRGRTLCEGIPS